MGELLAFLGVAALVIVTPGPDTAVTIRSALAGGRRAGVMTALGVASGQACWTLAATVGITALLVASEPAFVALKLAGAAYLVWLGIGSLRDALRRVPHAPQRRRPGRTSARAAYRQGLLSDLGNPKMAAFFTSLLPQFGGARFGLMLAFGLLFCAMTFLWLACYAAAIESLGERLRGSGLRRALDAVTGAVLVALGLRLAAEPRRL